MKKLNRLRARYQNKKTNIFGIVILVIVVVIMISFGWSAFSQSLEMNDMSAKVLAKADIRVTNVSVDSSTNSAVSNWEEYNVKNISSSIMLPNQDSSITFKVQITNLGNVEMGIFSLTGLADNLEYSIKNYNLKEKLCVEKVCKLGIQKDIYITIKYKENGFHKDQTDYSIFLNFDFRPIYKVTYERFMIPTESYPSEIIEGDTLIVHFPSEILKSYITVLVNGVNTSFKYENNTLEVDDVRADVIVQFGQEKGYTFMAEKSNGSDSDINFYDPILENGIFMHEETKNNPYPIYYYRGVVDNRVLYSKHCWKIVRTTETGGLKLIYDGEPSGNTCPENHTRLGSEAYNGSSEENASLSEVGYMYGLDIGFEEIKPRVEVGYLWGNDIVWDSDMKQYTLKETIVNTNLNDLEDDIRGGIYGNYSDRSINAFHYTCLNNTGICSTVYYVFYNNYGNVDEAGTALYSIPLTNGLDIESYVKQSTYESTNETPSLAKGTGNTTGDFVDDWFKNRSGINVDDLDDLVFCNDRAIGGLHGWDKDNDNHLAANKYLHFDAYKRLVEDQDRPTLNCLYKNDSFTVNNSLGNQKLTYPVALLTADEAVLAGAIYDVDTTYYLSEDSSTTLMTAYYFSDDNVRIFYLHSNTGKLSSVYTYGKNGIRPVINLKPEFKISGGDGTKNNPYILTK